MTVIDLTMITMSGYAIWWFRRSQLESNFESSGPILVVVGLALGGLFYAVDLLIMLVVPLWASPDAASAAMTFLHLNVSWVIIPLGIGTMFGGFLRTVRFQASSARELRESEERFKEAQRIASVGSWEWDVTTNTSKCSPEFFRLFGLPDPPQPFTYQWFLDALHPEDRAKTAKGTERALATGDPFDDKYRVVHPDGTVLTLYSRGQVIFEDGKAVGLKGTCQDITERERAEDALRSSEALLRDAQRIADMGSWIFHLGTGEAFWSEENYVLHGQSKEFKPSYEAFLDLLHPEDRRVVLDRTAAAISEKGALISDHRVVLPDGSVRFHHVAAVVEVDASGVPARIVGATRDVTESRQMEEALKASLAEKTVLLREVHHRVKNNLQIVSSLLHVTPTNPATDGAVRGVLSSVEQRVQAMALVHEHLYQKEDLAVIDVGLYLRDLVDHLFQGMPVSEGAIESVVDIESTPIPVDLAFPCGLIVNELVSNAMAHAFPGGASGHIRVTMGLEEERLFRLTVADDGVGLPTDLGASRSDTFGLELVRTLVDQIDGVLDVESGGGTEFVVTFPIREVA